MPRIAIIRKERCNPQGCGGYTSNFSKKFDQNAHYTSFKKQFIKYSLREYVYYFSFTSCDLATDTFCKSKPINN
ncbi:hypothetical protein COV18_01240 [Candidatus Woesearchaeota archaeon CG10_big_fil_rev_8_21_14_0_10_37_12]|nr:MAG: hypothetical protein COV18_01240 [Candidatus Woesearchaeota archaeon CG10_big_fil_rev_8_21_14_0_10_37_12]